MGEGQQDSAEFLLLGEQCLFCPFCHIRLIRRESKDKESGGQGLLENRVVWFPESHRLGALGLHARVENLKRLIVTVS